MSGCKRRFRCECTATLAVSVLAALPVLFPWGMCAAQTRDRPLSFERGSRDAPNVALTFDGGSDLGQSEQILAVLEQRGVVATFFLTGRFIRSNPELVRRIAAGGHEIGNHTWSHPHLTTWDHAGRHDLLPGLDREFLQRELRRTAREYEAVTGLRMAPLWRAPYGEVNDDLLRWSADAGWSHAGWTRDDAGGRHTLDSLDWVEERSSRNYLTSNQIAERILTFGGGGDGLNGGIVLMHLCARREDPGVRRLGELIDALRRDGYRLVTVTELRGQSSPPPPPLTAAHSLAASDRPPEGDPRSAFRW